MTLNQAIECIDRIRPNKYTAAQKLAWLSALDGRLFNEVILTHEGAEEAAPFAPYTEETAGDTPLLVPAPYDEGVYTHYLEARVAQANGEAAKYNQAAALYNSACSDWLRRYNRCLMPIGGERFRW